MKKVFVIANWKSNKTVSEAKNWFSVFSSQLSRIHVSSDIHLILCPSYISLQRLSDSIKQTSLPIELGVQNISPFPSGAYTGDVSAEMAKDLVQWVIIGHSERRKYFHESDDELFKKAVEVQKNGLKSIYCVEGPDQRVPESATIILYEPPNAIGSGISADPIETNRICRELSEKNRNIPVLYGGSVTEESIQGFLTQPDISGVGVGKASLDPEQFFRLVKAISSYE